MAISDNSIMYTALTARSDAPRLKKEALLSEVDKLKGELSSGQNNKSTTKLVELRRTYSVDVRGLKEKLRK